MENSTNSSSKELVQDLLLQMKENHSYLMPRGAVIININDVPTLIASAEKKEGKLMVQGVTLITKIPGTFYRMSDIVENNIMDCDNRSIELIVQKLKLCRANNLE